MATFILNINLKDGEGYNSAQFASLLQNLTPAVGMISERPVLATADDDDCLLILDSSAGTVAKITKASLIPQVVSSAQSIKETIAQTDHGFAVGNIVRKTATAGQYAKAKADTAANASGIVGIVESVPNTGSFVVVHMGLIIGLSGLTEGSIYRLSDTTAGGYTTATLPIDRPLFVALSATTALVIPCDNSNVKEYDENQYTSGVGTNTYTASLTPTLPAYIAGMEVVVKFSNANTGAATFNIDGLGAKDIQNKGAALLAGDILANHTGILRYDGVAFQLLNPAVTAPIPQSVRIRQTVLSGPVDISGLPSLLPATSASLSLSTQNVSSTTPIVATCAVGFGASGEVNRIGQSTTNLTWNGFTASTTSYAYLAVGSDSILTPGITTLAPIYRYGTDTLIIGQNVTSSSYAIASSSDSGYGVGNAFNGSTSDGYSWSNSPSTVNGVAWLGQNFGAGNSKHIRRIVIWQGSNDGSTNTQTISSVKVQFSDNGTTWTDAVTASVAQVYGTPSTIDVPATATHQYWRLLANSAPLNAGNYWKVTEVFMYEATDLTANGQFSFDIQDMKGYVGNGTSRVPAYWVFVGEVVAGASTITSTTAYAYKGKYMSALYGIAISTAYNLSHNIGCVPERVDNVLVCMAADLGFTVGKELHSGQFGASPAGMGAALDRLTFSTIVNGNGLYLNRVSDGGLYAITLANWKLKTLVERGW